MPQLRRTRTETETEAEELIEMGLEEDVSGDLQTTVEAVTSDKNANYFFFKLGQPRPLFCLFLVFSNKQYNFNNKLM